MLAVFDSPTSSRRWPAAVKGDGWRTSVRVAVALTAIGLIGARPGARAAEEPADPAELDKPVKDFELPDVAADKKVKLSDYKGKIVVLVWHSPGCSASPAYNDRIKEFVEAYKDKKVGLLLINSSEADDVKSLREYAEDEKFTFPVLRDGKAAVAGYFRIEQTGTFLIVDAKRVLRYRGGFDDSVDAKRVKRHYVKDAVETLLKGDSLLFKETFAFG
ncbi:MAG: redoxin domain-containing protein [Planctomycetes bacterium]|nr:redoxin domain-containing protein [Planctomycetota bacterium]